MLEYYLQLRFFSLVPESKPRLWAVREGGGSEHSREWPRLIGHLQVDKQRHAYRSNRKEGEFTFPTTGCCLLTPGVRGAAPTSRMETAALKCGAWVRGPTPQTILAPPQQRPQAMMLFISFEHTLKVHKAITKAIFQTKVWHSMISRLVPVQYYDRNKLTSFMQL